MLAFLMLVVDFKHTPVHKLTIYSLKRNSFFFLNALHSPRLAYVDSYLFSEETVIPSTNFPSPSLSPFIHP